MDKPSVSVLSLGGTIAMRADGARADGVVPSLTGEQLVAAVPGLAEVARVDARSFRQLPSAELGFDDIAALADVIRSLAQAGRRGVVVTQGTDTIEETAFALDRLLDVDMPVVVTGAMRHPETPGADGPGNLLAAVRVAASDAARGCGCLVVMNDEIHAARFVRKGHTSRPDAFASPLAGRIGWVVEARVRMVLQPPRVPALATAVRRPRARVALVTAALGDDGGPVGALLAGGAQGLVVEATGGGHVQSGLADALAQAAARIPVVLASRTGAGEVLAETYGFPGGEIDLQARGLIRAGWLDPPKARVLLTLLLRRGVAERDAVAAAFRPWGG